MRLGHDDYGHTVTCHRSVGRVVVVMRLVNSARAIKSTDLLKYATHTFSMRAEEVSDLT